MDDQAGKPQSAVTWVKLHSKHRKATRQVLTELAMFIDAGNSCPSHKDIADETGLSKSTVSHALGTLEKDGTITRTKNGGAKVKGGKKDCYAIAGLAPVKPQAELKPAPESVAMITIPVESVVMASAVMTTVVTTTVVNPEPAEYAPIHVHEGGDAAGEKDLLPEKEKTTTAFVVVREPEPEKPIIELDNDLGKVAKAYQNNIALLTEVSRGILETELETTPADWIVDAITIAVEANVRTWKYVKGILGNWKTKGRDAPKPTSAGTPSIPAYIPVVERKRMPLSEVVDMAVVNAGRKAVPQ